MAYCAHKVPALFSGAKQVPFKAQIFKVKPRAAVLEDLPRQALPLVALLV